MTSIPVFLEVDTPDWTLAKCRGVGNDLFFPSRGESTKEAIAVCETCPIKVDCLEYALDAHELHGIWGGTSERQRRRLRRGRAPRPRAIKHGTYGGYQQHRRRGEPACADCLQANAVKCAAFKAARRIGRGS